ncbi:MAG: hypothetical protein ACREKS_12575 [Candidatus Rokuibacteriota bacterium]
MDLTHCLLAGLIAFVIGITIWGFVTMSRLLKKDEAIDAATFLALRELRERFDRTT